MTPEAWLREALDPTTPSARLNRLGSSAFPIEVQRAVLRNPNVDQDILELLLEGGDPDAWANPAVPFVLLENGAKYGVGAYKAFLSVVKEDRWELAPVIREHAFPVADAWWRSPSIGGIERSVYMERLGLAAEPNSHDRRRAVRAALNLMLAGRAQLVRTRRSVYDYIAERALADVETFLEGRAVDLAATRAALPKEPPRGDDLSDYLFAIASIRRVVLVGLGDSSESHFSAIFARTARFLPKDMSTADRSAFFSRIFLDAFPTFPMPVGFSP